MSYQEHITAFYDQLETNPLSSSAIALWHALLYTKKKAGNIEKFSVAMSLLMERSGLKEGTFKKARMTLKTKGYISYESRKGNQAAIYEIVLQSYNDRNSIGNSDLQSYNDGNSIRNSIGNSITLDIDRQIERNIDRQDEPKLKSTWSEILEEWKTVFGFDIKPNHAERLGTYIDHDGMAESLILEGIERVRQSDKKVMNYLWTILSNWAKSNVKTIADLQMHERQRSDGEGGTPSSKKQSNLDFLAEYKRKRGIGT
ncbi:DnaD domain protein [Sutcliffiella horikoshii]|uniref:DnaD domain-containing protein n=1 Tax=Sutcliffiella horikoshii TaxID=79883 RepID=UPI003CF971EF